MNFPHLPTNAPIDWQAEARQDLVDNAETELKILRLCCLERGRISIETFTKSLRKRMEALDSPESIENLIAQIEAEVKHGICEDMRDGLIEIVDDIASELQNIERNPPSRA